MPLGVLFCWTSTGRQAQGTVLFAFPEQMCKLLFLQHLYNLSDERVIEEAELNIAYLYFLALNPEDTLPDKSLLSKFRTHRLEETTLDDIITEIVRQCVKQGIIESTSLSIDATHIEANTIHLLLDAYS